MLEASPRSELPVSFNWPNAGGWNDGQIKCPFAIAGELAPRFDDIYACPPLTREGALVRQADAPMRMLFL